MSKIARTAWKNSSGTLLVQLYQWQDYVTTMVPKTSKSAATWWLAQMSHWPKMPSHKSTVRKAISSRTQNQPVSFWENSATSFFCTAQSLCRTNLDDGSWWLAASYPSRNVTSFVPMTSIAWKNNSDTHLLQLQP